MKDEQKVIVREIDLDRNLCIKIKEIKTLLDYYPLCHPYRLQFALLAVTGMRGCEIKNLKAKDFTQKFSHLTYKIYKPVTRIGATGVVTVTYKKRTVQIPEFLQRELKEYARLNYHTMKAGYFFYKCSPDSLRLQLRRLREKVKDGRLIGENWQGFIEEVDDVYEYDMTIEERGVLQELEEKEGFTLQKSYKHKYRIALHSLRRFYITFRLWQKYKGDIILTSREIGHSKADTTMIYSYAPEKIGLPKDANERHTFDYFFGKGKVFRDGKINPYGEEKIEITLPSELMDKIRQRCLRDNITTDSYFRKTMFKEIIG
tara:strand:- start:1322 stop:2269 length:948 start_codon:yes stop_codon:yes gene_type:complete